MRTVPVLLILLGLISGCASRQYKSTRADGTAVEVKSTTFLVWGRLNGFRASAAEVRVGSAEGGSEAEKLAPLAEAIARGAAAGALKP